MLSERDLKIMKELELMNEAQQLAVLSTKSKSANANVSRVVELIKSAQVKKQKTLAITAPMLQCDTFSIATVYSAMKDCKIAVAKQKGKFEYPVKFIKSSASQKNSDVIACVIGIM